MNNKNIKYMFGLILLSALLIVGCGSGGSQSVLQQESPESAVMRISNSWRASNNSPAVVVDANNNFIRQANSQESSDNNSASNSTDKVIYLKDLAGNEPYKLEVVNVEKVDNTAAVTCNFYYENGTLSIEFKLIFEEDKWWLDDVIITDSPLAEGEAGYQVQHHLYIGEKELRYVADSEKGKIDSEVEAQARTFEGFAYIASDSRNISKGVILATSDSSYPLTLHLYYKKLATYTLSLYFLDKNKEIVSTMTREIKSVGFVGDTVSLTEDDYEEISGYKIITENFSETIYNISEITLQDGNTNELKLYYELNNGENNEIEGTVTDVEGKALAATIQLYKVNEKGNTDFIASLETENGQYSFKELEDGEYLLVVSANGHEPKTTKITLPNSGSNNIRANIKM